MEYQSSHSMFFTHGIARLTTSHGPTALRCPGNGREPPIRTVINPQRDLMQDVGPEVSDHVPAHTWCYVCLTCVGYVYSYRTQPKYNI